METRYYFDGLHYMKLEVYYDESFFCNPRETCDNAAVILACCRDWYRPDIIIDEPGYNKDAEDALRELVRDDLKEKQVISFVKRKKTHLRLVYDRHNMTWSLYSGDNLYNDTDQAVDWLIDDIIDELTPEECVDLLEAYTDRVFLPLDCADYGCNGYRLRVSHYRDFSDCNSLAWITKEKVIEWRGDAKEWKQRGYETIEDEVNAFDLYLQGYCYFANWYQYDFANRDWIDYESCGGFLSDKYGDDLFQEIAGTSATMYEDFNDLYKGVRKIA